MPLAIAEYISQTNKTQRPLLIWLLSVGTALSILILIVAAPLAAATGHTGLAASIYRPFHTVCHQLPERSFFLAGHQLAVCARCTGLYLGFSLLLFLYPLIRPLRSTVLPRPKWLFLAAAPLAVDFGLTFFGFWENTHTSRVLSGMLLGGVTVFYVMPGLAELSMRVGGVRPASSRSSPFTVVSRENITTAPSDYSAPERRI
jgi:uncharacterized membrane protein